MSAVSLIVIAVLLLGLFLLSQRNRQRAASRQTQLRESIAFGTQVMTTSGLYGTVTGVNDDDSVQLSIAPGVEVKWAIAALRDIAALPDQYRKPITGPQHPDDPSEDPPEQ
jgi:preprotein translocase subunit YajC